MSELSKYLNQHIVGNVFSTKRVVDMYSTDRSILKIKPRCVAFPENTHDIRKILRFSNQLSEKGVSLPITARGSGLDQTGAAIGDGMIVSLEKMNNILEVDPRQKLVRCQAGVTLGELNAALVLYGLSINVAADQKHTVGGLIANYFQGTSREKYGSIARYVYQAELVLANGDCIQTEKLNRRGLQKKKDLKGFEGEIYRKVDRLLEKKKGLISRLQASPSVNLNGYREIANVKYDGGNRFDLFPVVLASQGTLGVISEVILQCDYITNEPKYLMTYFNKIESAIQFADAAKKMDPTELNIYDLKMVAEAEKYGKKLHAFPSIPKNGYLILVVFDDENRGRSKRNLARLAKTIKDEKSVVLSDDNNLQHFEELRAILSSFLNDIPRGDRIPLVDDVYVPDPSVVEYIKSLKNPFFGSLLTNLFTVRPVMDLMSINGRQEILTFLRDYSKMVYDVGGTLTGGTPEGRVKAVATNAKEDPELLELWAEIRKIFDPNGVMNPGIKNEASLRTTIRQMRTSYELGVIQE